MNPDPSGAQQRVRADRQELRRQALIASIAHTIETECAVWEETFNAGPGLVVGVRDAALVAVDAMLDDGLIR